jgi:hypothetical protein
MKLHPKAIQKIENKIKGSLINCHIKDNWPQYESFSKHIESLGKEVLKHRKEWLNINDIFSIFYDFVYKSIIEKVGADQQVDVNLWDFLGEEDGNKLTTSFKEFLISIPREYDVYIPLPINPQSIPGSIELSNSISLVLFKEADKVSGGVQIGLQALRTPKTQLGLNTVYIRQRLSGYCGNRLENASIKQATRNFKIILQQAKFKNLFKPNPEKITAINPFAELSHHQVPRTHIISVDIRSDPVELIKTELPLDFCKWLNSINLNSEADPLNRAIRDGKIEQLIISWLKKPIELIECDAEEAIRVASAIQWCFNSYTLENETLAFLQVCIGFEALLGDDSKSGALTETLADRCSYLISNDIKGRKSIKSTFKELYGVRSKIVHGNATELDSNQRWYGGILIGGEPYLSLQS